MPLSITRALTPALSLQTGRGRSERGFTLLELLVAITLLSLVSLIMLGGLKFGTRVWERSAGMTDDAESVEAAQRFIRHQLVAVYPAWQADGPNQGHVLFDGSANRLSFIGPPPAPAAPAGHQQFELTLASDRALAVSWRPDSRPGDAAANEAPLLTGIENLDLAYFGPDPSGRNPRWWDGWVGRAQPPQLIRVRVRFPPGDRRVWPELVVHPEIMVDVGCVYDPIYRGCRGR